MTSTPTETTQSPGRRWLDLALDTTDPQSMTGAAVTGLLAVLVKHDEAESQADADTAAYDELRAEYDQLEAEADRRLQVIDDVREAIKKSTSKLANEVRAIIEGPATEPKPAAAEPAGNSTQPPDDAPVEQWRGYARGRGFQGPDVDDANRSQIRTLLGLSHFDGAGA